MKYKLYRLRIVVVRVMICIIFTIFVWGIIFLANGIIEKSVVRSEIDSFKERGTYDKTINIQGQKVDMYKVSPLYDYEDAETFVFDDSLTSLYYIGSKTDIILTNRNPLRMYQTAIIRDIADICARNFFIGHATMNLTDDGSEVIECVGNDVENNGVRIVEQVWVYTEVRNGNDAQTILGLRLKNIDKQTKDRICENLRELEGKEYNYLLPFYSKNKYYCTDLISRVLKKENININYDHFYTTGNDMIISNNTYLIFLCERIEEGYFKIYYLSEV